MPFFPSATSASPVVSKANRIDGFKAKAPSHLESLREKPSPMSELLAKVLLGLV